MYYPILLDIKGKYCIVIGGGEVAGRKIREVVNCGAHVTIVSPGLSEELKALLEQGKIQWHQRLYHKDDLTGAVLCFACTDDGATNSQIAEDAKAAGIPVNIADGFESSTFIVPATRRKGDVTLSVYSAGNPGASRYLADRLLRHIEDWLIKYIEIVRQIRIQCKKKIADPKVRQNFIKKLYSPEFIDSAQMDTEEAKKRADRLMQQLLEPYSGEKEEK